MEISGQLINVIDNNKSNNKAGAKHPNPCLNNLAKQVMEGKNTTACLQ